MMLAVKFRCSGAVVFAVTHASTILADLIFIIAEGTIQSCKFREADCAYDRDCTVNRDPNAPPLSGLHLR